MTPKSIVQFERFAYLSLILGLAAPVINWPVISKRPDASPAFLVLTALISVAIQIVLIRRIVRRRNWARWIFIVLLGFGTVMTIVIQTVRPSQHNGLAGTAVFYLCYVAALVAAYFLLTPQARAWFKLPPGEIHDPSDMRIQS